MRISYLLISPLALAWFVTRSRTAQHSSRGAQSANFILAHSSPSPTLSSEAIWVVRYCTNAGAPIVITANSNGTVKLWRVLSDAPYCTIAPERALGIVGLAVDPNPNEANYFIINSIDSVLSRYDFTGTRQATKELKGGASWSVAIQPGTGNLATVGLECVVSILSSDIDTFGELLSSVKGRGGMGLGIEFTKDGTLLAISSDTGEISLFATPSSSLPTLLTSFRAHASPVRSLTFTSNLLITASDDKQINLFDLRGLMNAATGGGGSRASQVATLSGHESWVVKVSTRNDRLLASGSSDGTIKLWDLNSFGTAIATLRDHAGDVWSLAFAPPEVGSVPESSELIEGLGGGAAGLGRTRFVSGGEDGKLRWWRN